jgi:hypothetical protein
LAYWALEDDAKYINNTIIYKPIKLSHLHLKERQFDRFTEKLITSDTFTNTTVIRLVFVLPIDTPKFDEPSIYIDNWTTMVTENVEPLRQEEYEKIMKESQDVGEKYKALIEEFLQKALALGFTVSDKIYNLDITYNKPYNVDDDWFVKAFHAELLVPWTSDLAKKYCTSETRLGGANL